jgi:hypothetical protein
MNISVAQSSASTLAREVLTATRTYYVRTDGSDSNNGLANTSGGAFLTIQRGVDEVANTLDISAQAVVIRVADGAYNAPVILKPFVGSGTVVLRGNVASPANVTITLSGANCVAANTAGRWHVEGLKLSVTSGGFNCIDASTTALSFALLVFGASTGHHLVASRGGSVTASGNYEISGNANFHISAQHQGLVFVNNRTVTLTGTPAFTYGFVFSSAGSEVYAPGMTFVGAATGPYYAATLNGVIDTSGAMTPYFPGNAAGTVSSGGQYV